MKKKPPGLYANIQAKRARGEKMRKPGEEGAPSASDFKNAAKTAKEKKGVKREDPKGNPAGYFDKEGCKTCAGGKKPCKCSKKDMVGRKSSYADGYGKKCDSIAAEFNAVLLRNDKKCGASGIPDTATCTKKGSVRGRAGQGAKLGAKIGGASGAIQGAALGSVAGPGGALLGGLGGAAGGAVGGAIQGGLIGGIVGQVEKGSGRSKKYKSSAKRLKSNYKKAYHTGKAKGLSRKKMQELDQKYAMKFARAADRR